MKCPWNNQPENLNGLKLYASSFTKQGARDWANLLLSNCQMKAWANDDM